MSDLKTIDNTVYIRLDIYSRLLDAYNKLLVDTNKNKPKPPCDNYGRCNCTNNICTGI